MLTWVLEIAAVTCLYAQANSHVGSAERWLGVWHSLPREHFCFTTGLPSPRLTSETLAPSLPVPKDCKQWFHSLQRSTILQCTLPMHPEYMCKHSFYVPPQTMVSFNTPCAHFSNTIVLRYSHPFHSHICSLFLPCSFPWHPVTTALICGNLLMARPCNHPDVKQHFLLKIFNRILENPTLCSSPSHLVMSMLEVSR